MTHILITFLPNLLFLRKVSEIVAWHHSHAKGRHVKGINILSCLVSYNDAVLPFGYEIVHKDVSFSDTKTRKVKRKASTSKNEHFRNLIQQSRDNKVLFAHLTQKRYFAVKLPIHSWTLYLQQLTIYT